MITGWEEGPSKIVTPDFVVSTLLADPESIENEWMVTPSFNIQHLSALVSNRVEEVFFTEQSGQLWVNDRSASAYYGISGFTPAYNHLEDREKTGRLQSHIHPKHLDAFLSWPDIWNVVYNFQSQASYVLFHSEGGIEYTSPFNKNEYRRGLFVSFSEQVGIDCLSVPDLDGLIHISDVNVEKQIELARVFANQNGLIKQEYKWNNTRGMQRLVDIVNLKH